MKDFLLFILSLRIKLKKNDLCQKITKFLRKRYIFFLPVVLLLFLTTLVIVNISIKNEVFKNEPRLAFSNFLPVPYARLNVLGSHDIDISAQAAVVMDDSSKVVIFGKNEELRFSTASTAKIMTALTALDHYRLNDILTIKTDNVEGSVVGFKKGEQFTFENLLYAMLLPSGNDAALAIAQNYKGGEIEFVKKMNKNASRFHLFNTHFSDPAGLLDDQDYTTALALARLSSIAMNNEVFSRVVATKQRIISNAEGTENYFLNNLNKLLDIKGVNGVKTGFTSEALGVLVTSKIQDNKKFIIVVMRSQDRFLDTEKLLSLVDGNVKYFDISP